MSEKFYYQFPSLSLPPSEYQTSVAASSTMYQLSQNEDKQEKLFAELQRALSKKDSKITASTLEQLPYLKACIKETLRMYPVVLGNGRSLQSDAVIAGYNVPKGVNDFFCFTFASGNSISFPIFLDSCDFPALRSVE
jgi:cytochrome P450 family 49 subfamily A